MEKIIFDLMLGFFFNIAVSDVLHFRGEDGFRETNERYGQAMNIMFLKNLCWSKNFIHNHYTFQLSGSSLHSYHVMPTTWAVT